MMDEKDSNLKKYIKGFIEFENYINNLKSNNSNFKYHSGYLINLEKIEEIKTKINYTFNKNNYNNLLESPMDNPNEKIYIIEEIEFRNSNYLLNKLFNGNKYILINEVLWKLLCKEGKEKIDPIIYEINYLYLKLRLKDGKKLIFINRNDNQISKDNFYATENPEYHTYESIFKNIENNIFNKVKEYYNYEIFFKNSLSQGTTTKYYKGYLIDINWFNKWAKFYDYSYIKSNYLEKKKPKKEIIDHLIYILELNKINNKILDGPKVNKFSNKNELESFLQKNKLVIVDISLFSQKLEEKRIYYCLYDGKIKFYFENKEPLILETKDNIISMNSEENIEKTHLMQIAKIFYFRKSLKEQMLSDHKNVNNSIILIKKEIIDTYLLYFNYQVLYDLLNQIPFDYKNIEQKFDIVVDKIKKHIKNYFDEIKKKGKTFSINLEGVKYILKPQPYKIDNKTLFYISDFEIIDEDIFSFFKGSINISDKHIIRGKYIAEDEKIFLAFNYNSVNFYEIGNIDVINGNFIIEYILDEYNSLKSKVFESINNLGIKNFLTIIQNSEIKIGTGVIGHCYNFRKNNDGIDNDIDMNDNIYNINFITSTLINLYIFEQNIKQKIELSKNQINDLSNVNLNSLSSASFKLVNENYLKEIKNLFDYQRLKKIITQENLNNYSEIPDQFIENVFKKNLSYKNFLLSKKSEFFDLKKRAFEFYNIQLTPSSEHGENKFQYPMVFNVINESLFNDFLTLLDLKGLKNTKKAKEILLTYNNGNIVFTDIEQNKNNVGEFESFLYIYSSDIEKELNSIKYYPEAILAFKNNTDLINNLQLIMKENIIEKLTSSQNNLASIYGFKIRLLSKGINQNNNDGNQLNEEYLFDNDSQKYFNELLNFSFLFNFRYKDFYNPIKLQQEQNDEKMYLINKNYIDEIKLITYFSEINTALEKDKDIENLFLKGDINYFVKLKESLGGKILINFYNSNKKDVLQKLDKAELSQKSIKQLNNYFYNNLFYYTNFQLINQKILDILGKIDNNLKKKYIAVKALFSDNRVILLLEYNGKYIINVGNINSTDELKIEYVIQSDYKNFIKEDLKIIFNKIQKEGFNKFYTNYIQSNKIYLNINQNYIKATIYKINSEENSIGINSNEITSQKKSYISEKLKAMILLSICQINFDKFRENNQKRIEEVYLLNYNYLKEYKYDEIISLLISNSVISKFIEQLKDLSNLYHLKSVELIIEKLKIDDLLKIDKELQNINLYNKNSEAKYGNIMLKNKSISICKEFILVPKIIIEEIKSKNILPLYSLKRVFYYTYNNGDIFASDYNYEYYILFGNISKTQDNQLFNLKYILNYDYQSSLTEELKIIQKYGIEYYKEKKTVFSKENNKDLISPIFSEGNELGNFYKYTPGINYQINKGEDYTKYLKEGNFFKVCKLYNYYSDFRKNLEKNIYVNDKGYYLINKDVMNSIKKDYNYNTISDCLNNIQFPIEMHNKMKMLYILKNLPTEIYEGYVKDTEKKDTYLNYYTAPNQVTFTIPEPPNESINIYDNFEIIDSSIAKEFISGIYGPGYEQYMRKDENFIDCSIREGKVIVFYPYSKFQNNKYVYQIGSINQDNTFIPEYLIIYMKNNSHFDKIKYNLNNYLSSLENQFVNGIYPIIKEPSFLSSFEELGKIINLSQINNGSIVASNNQYEGKMDLDNDYDNYGNNNFKKPGKKGIIINTDENKKNNSKIQKYNLEEQTVVRDIKSNFSLPPLIGLDNIGATCYMNATLQCLCNIQKFVNYFKYNKYLKEKVKTDLLYTNNMLLSSSFKLLIEELWPDRLYFNNNPNPIYNQLGGFWNNNTYLNKKNESYAPKEFKKKISKMNPLFEGVAANDAKDLVNFLIMTLHDELNSAEKKNFANSAINQDQSNQQLMFNLFSQDFINNNKSIISDLFYGVNYSIVQCQNCFHKSYNYQTYFFFVFPLEEVRIFKNQNNFNNNFNYNMNFNNNEVNIYDCFLYDQKINYMMGQNAMYCNFCKNTTNTQMCTFLVFGPEIIIIILNRGKGIQFKVKINFVEELNLYNFIEHKETGVIYQLIGVITHLGGDGMDGHFIAYCKNPISNSWYQYNDSLVNEVNYANFKTEVIDYAMPYLLFYQKKGK